MAAILDGERYNISKDAMSVHSGTAPYLRAVKAVHRQYNSREVPDSHIDGNGKYVPPSASPT